ncbi:phosphatase domain-containing protein [Sorangium sp. So ce1024]|uniref:phosphatase domain-containing protein n=1 Tax=unclassified Sorangium TaxID=2621164 RepID=UPI003F0602A1
MESGPVLELDGFGFAFGERTIVRAIDLSVPAPGLFTLLGPVAAGKSSLLRLLSGVPEALCAPGSPCQSWGRALFRGAPLGERGRPSLAGQRARLLMGTVFEQIADTLRGREKWTRLEQRELVESELRALGAPGLASGLDLPMMELPSAEQRCVAMVGAWVTGSALLCVDEPTAGLDERGRAVVLALIERLSSERAVLFVTHNLDDVRALGGEVALIAGGVLQERCSARQFLSSPSSAAGRRFVDTGSCSVPSPDAVEEELDPGVFEAAGEERAPAQPGATAPPSEVAAAANAARWVVPELLAGIPRPGLLRDVESDLGALAAARVRRLVCLETAQPIPAPVLAAFGIEARWLPIEDMGAPSVGEMRSLCEDLAGWIERGEPVAVHCRGGLGRTGTVLAAYFIWRGASAPQALSAVRRVEPRFVQSAEQLDFLRRFAGTCRERRSSDATPVINEER